MNPGETLLALISLRMGPDTTFSVIPPQGLTYNLILSAVTRFLLEELEAHKRATA